MRLLARIGIERDVLDDAQLLLEGVLALAPDYHAARFDYAQVLVKRHMYAAAQEQAQKLLAADPADRNYRTLLAMTYVGLGRHEQAMELYRDLLPGAVQPAELHLSIAHSLKTLGRREEAIVAYRNAAGARAAFGDAYWSLANLKTYRFEDEELAQMRAAEAAAATVQGRPLPPVLRPGQGARGPRRSTRSPLRTMRAATRSSAPTAATARRSSSSTRACRSKSARANCSQRNQDSGATAPDPIFIVGLPRSGSTLIEQILASHSAVEGTHELADIPRMVVELQGREWSFEDPRYPAVLAQLQAQDFRRLGEKYLHDTRAYRSGKARFIDKMPNNFRHIGLIHLMLPNAKIIDARREPMACCFSNFKQLFAHGQEFSYSIEDIARYYRTYLELMRHWDAVLPGRVLRVQHEDLVDDLEGNVRRILDYCGLQVRARLCRVPQDRTQRAHRELRAGTPADLP